MDTWFECKSLVSRYNKNKVTIPSRLWNNSITYFKAQSNDISDSLPFPQSILIGAHFMICKPVPVPISSNSPVYSLTNNRFSSCFDPVYRDFTFVSGNSRWLWVVITTLAYVITKLMWINAAWWIRIAYPTIVKPQ